MAYADRNTGGSRIVSIVIVSIVVAVLCYGFVNGLTFSYVKKMTEKLNTFDVVEPPPPPPETPPPPPPEQPQLQTPPVVSPPPIVRVQSPPPPVFNQTQIPPPSPPQPLAAAPAPVPVPAPPVISRAAGAKGDPSAWVTTDDYPSDALSAEAQGTSRIKWEINTAGRVENCVVVASSGNSSLDRAACSNITRRGRYTPAQDASGKPMRSSSGRNVVWRLPE
ncbi:energy transducer TonB [Sphingomonas sp. HMP6]|uniref:energy transducer TonB n=1 Tax=Sphingomonas sp. HMP6 TaxID=1517551 RepID=UPI001596E820|nr:energy transducer TonB [Sphingomonas sp. HMP6]BCA58753.1 energy transducer TonB [Sphingomonas sp. HMP6]